MLMRHYGGLNHTNIGTLQVYQVNALTDYLEKEAEAVGDT